MFGLSFIKLSFNSFYGVQEATVKPQFLGSLDYANLMNEKFRNQEGVLITDTQWHSIVAWGKTAEIIAQYVNKGQEIAIEGKLTHRTYTSPEGETKYKSEVLCTEVLLLQNKAVQTD